MNQVLTALIMAGVLAGAGTVHAGDRHKKGGWQDAREAQISSVQQVRNMPDESKVVMQGQIEKRVKKDKYQFKDQTGYIIVEIDEDVWDGQTVTPQDTIWIFGELDNGDESRPEVDVKRLKKK